MGPDTEEALDLDIVDSDQDTEEVSADQLLLRKQLSSDPENNLN